MVTNRNAPRAPRVASKRQVPADEQQERLGRRREPEPRPGGGRPALTRREPRSGHRAHQQETELERQRERGGGPPRQQIDDERDPADGRQAPAKRAQARPGAPREDQEARDRPDSEALTRREKRQRQEEEVRVREIEVQLPGVI